MKATALAIGSFVTALTATAYADVPAGYKGTPFDPAVAGGTCNGVPTSTVATKGPYPLPGRIYFKNHDMGGSGVGFMTTDHYTFGGNCWRTDDNPEGSFSLTAQVKDPYSAVGDVYYDTGDPTLDGTPYPGGTNEDIYIAAVRPGDWVNITVNVETAGTYRVGSTWATGNGPPGGEGGNGGVELQVSSNGTMLLDWKDVFPNYMTTANFHSWKPYPNMGMVTLAAGVQVIKLLSPDPHLNLDYVQFSLVTGDGGLDTGSSGAPLGSSGAASSGTSMSGAAASGLSSGASSGTSVATTGATAASGSISTSGTPMSSGTAATGAAASGSSSGTSTAPSSGTTSPASGASTSGTAGTSGASAPGGGSGTSAVSSTKSSSSGCAAAAPADSPLGIVAIGLALLGAAKARGRRGPRKRS